MRIYAWRATVEAKGLKRIPKHWPLHARVIDNTEGWSVWRWLIRFVHDHHVMIKIPVTCFTLPHPRDSGEYWRQSLSGV